MKTTIRQELKDWITQMKSLQQALPKDVLDKEINVKP